MAELRQKMMVCVSTMERLNGRAPAIGELRVALGSEYDEVLEEYAVELVEDYMIK